MAFDLPTYAKLRPYSYHLTARGNLQQIVVDGVMRSAEKILTAAGREDLLCERRTEHVRVVVAGRTVLIRDQGPLYEGRMTLLDGLSFGDFVLLVNQRIFFWPGMAGGPIAQGVRHFGRYKSEGPVVIRVKTAELFEANKHTAPEFAHFNTGAPRPRPIDRKGSPRGLRTFLPCHEFERTAGKVVELTFPGEVNLPADACEWQTLGHDWAPLSAFRDSLAAP